MYKILVVVSVPIMVVLPYLYYYYRWQRMQEISLSLITLHIQQISSMICIIDSVILKLVFAKKVIYNAHFKLEKNNTWLIEI